MNILVFDPNVDRGRATTGTNGEFGRTYTTRSVSDLRDLIGQFQSFPVLILDESVGFQTVQNIQQQSPGVCILIAMVRKDIMQVRKWMNEVKVAGIVRYPISPEEVEPFLQSYASVMQQEAGAFTAVASESASPYMAPQAPVPPQAPPFSAYDPQQVQQMQTRVVTTPWTEPEISTRSYVPRPVHVNRPVATAEAPLFRSAVPTRQEMVSITSSRGGVGKSTITYNLAALAAKNGIRTVVIDCDPKGNIALISGTEISHTADSWAGIDEKDASENTVMQLLSRMPCGAFLLASGSQDTVNGMSELTMTKVLAMLKRYFQFILVDCEPGFSESQIVAYEQSNKILLVSSDDITTYKRTIELARDIRSLDLDPNKIHLLMNGVKKGKNLIHRLEDLTECKNIGSLPVTPELDKAKETATALASTMPKLEFAKESHRVLSQLIRIETVTGDGEPSGGLLSKLFGGKKKRVKASESA